MNRRQFFEMHAEKWDASITKDLLMKIEKKVIPLFVIKKADRILDIGSGTGILLPFLKKAAGKKGEIVALDYSSRMLEKAKEKYGNKYQYVHANAENIPFPDAYFDKVICLAVFPHFPHKLKVLREIRRVMKKGGQLIIAHTDHRKTINVFHRKVGGPVGHDHMPDNRNMLMLMKRAGFNGRKIEEGRDWYLAFGKR